MLKDKAIRTALCISLIGHLSFLSIPTLKLTAFEQDKPQELLVQIEIEEPSRLPKIERMGKEKRFKLVSPTPTSVGVPASLPVTQLKTDEPANRQTGKPANRPTGRPANTPPVKPTNQQTGKPANWQTDELANEAMFRYQDMVKQRIEEARRYPEWARGQGIEGVAHLRFVILANGNGQEIKLVRSSDSKILDREAVDTIERASPFPPFPEEVASSSIRMEVSLVFTLK